MLKKLSQAQYPAVLPLFAALDHQLAIRSAVEGHTPAQIYADRPVAPRLALLWDRCETLAVAGESQDMMALAALRNLLHNHLLPEARGRGVPQMVFSAGPAWMALAPGLLHGLDAALASRRAFRLEPDAPVPPDPVPPVPEGFHLLPLTAALLDDPSTSVRGWVDSYWHSVEVFLREGFGWAARSADGEIAAWCLTVFASNAPGARERELGLETAAPYRGRGLGTLTAAACARQARESGVRLRWQCWAEHSASAAIASRLGFNCEGDTAVYRFRTGLK
jgi:GNAT superfamily N-acetyltransferase